ncbi:TadE family type IV pilus minor pilin [Corynebacterium variabile]|uniref:TadE family type IV pilus minor pilin n=1 Tax=Corynebacterium variabile TaxID=1727 RepID=UPI003A8E5DA1
MPSTRSDLDRSDAGYVTVEAAIMFTALTVVVGLVVAGIVTVASYLGAVDLARDAARAAALDPGNASGAASPVVSSVDADAQVSVSGGGGGDDGGGSGLITVQITRPGHLFDLSATAVIVAEPAGESQ